MGGYHCTITDDDCRAIAADRKGGMTLAAVAAKYGVSIATVSLIATGRMRSKATGIVGAKRYYPKKKPGSNDYHEALECDMTEAEIEALIAEQLPTMPNEPRDYPRESRLPQAVLRGLGVRMMSSYKPTPQG